MKRLLLIIFAVIIAPLVLLATTYSTTFTALETPLSESGAFVRAGSAFDQLNSVSGVARVSAGLSVDNLSIYNTAPGNNQCSSSVVSTSAGGANDYTGVTTRVTPEEGTGFDGYVLIQNDNFASIVRYDDGSPSLLTSSALSVTAPYTLMLCSVGNAHTVYKDGTTTGITASDSMYGSGKVGIYMAAFLVTDVEYSDWSGGDSADFIGGSTTSAIPVFRRRRN